MGDVHEPEKTHIRTRLEQAREEWLWHDARGDEREGYGVHMSQFLYRMPADSQTFDMKTSIDSLIADLGAALEHIEATAQALDDAATFITTHGTFHHPEGSETRTGWNQACAANADYLNGKAKEIRDGQE